MIILFALISISLAVGAHLADCSPSHIFYPLWPPHAKFYTGQTLSFSIALAVLTICFSWRKISDKNFAVLTTAAFASVYWVTQACAIFYPGTAFAAPSLVSSPTASIAIIPTQIVLEAIELILIGAATFIALRPNSKWTDN